MSKMEKNCIGCQTFLPLGMFSKHNKSKDGLYYVCRACAKGARLNNQRTQDGLASLMYRTQKVSSQKRGMAAPIYTVNEFKSWLFSQEKFLVLYYAWVESGYDRWKKPSVDRKDDGISYMFSNIQLMTWKENQVKSCLDRTSGVNTKSASEVWQYDLEGNFICKYFSQSHASRVTGVNKGNLNTSVKKKGKTAGGFIWSEKEMI